MLHFYREIIVSRLRYTLPVHSIAPHQLKNLEQFSRKALKVYIGVTRFAENTATLARMQYCPLQLQPEAKTMGHLTRLYRTPSTARLNRFLQRSSSRVGCVTTNFLEEVGASSLLPPPFAPHTLRSLLDMFLLIPSMGRKDVPQVVISQLVADHFSSAKAECLEVLFGGSVCPSSKTANAAFSTRALDIDIPGRINI